MLTACQPLSSTSTPTSKGPSSLLATSGFDDNISIITRRLQVLSYVLSELSSASTLLDDYVRAMQNIPHRLLAAWQSIAAAANPYSSRSIKQSANAARQQSVCRRLEDIAARHVEFLRRVVVRALFRQFLHVSVEDSSGDRMLRGCLGRGFHTDFFSTGYFDIRSRDPTHQTHRPSALSWRFRVMKRRRRWRQKLRRSFTVGSDRALPLADVGMPPGSTDGAPLTLQHFMRAALFFNPTVCAHELMSRCVLRIRHMLRVDDEVGGRAASSGAHKCHPTGEGSSVDTGMNRECEDGFFCVFVAPRVVDPCEHDTPCFGNCKFIFVLCAGNTPRSAHISRRESDCEKGIDVNVTMAHKDARQMSAKRNTNKSPKYKNMTPCLVLHATRCSATGAFFDFNSMPLSSPRLLTYRRDALRQALLLPPNAGHDTHHVSPTREDAAPEITSGDAAFAQELCERLAFWHARGQPQRMYYDPCVANADSSMDGADEAKVPAEGFSSVHSHSPMDSDRADDAGARPDVWATLPLLLLFSHVGVIEFRAPGPSAPGHRAPAGRAVLRQALEEATEAVVVAVRECRRHRRWHNHPQGSTQHKYQQSHQSQHQGRREGFDGTLSHDACDPFAYGRYDDVETDACVSWAQGGSGNNDNINKNNNNRNNASSIHKKGRKNTVNEETYTHSLSRRKLSAHEQQQRHRARLATEFRLSHSRRLDVLLVNARLAKPLAALVLRQFDPLTDTTLVPHTTFIVCSFTHYVAPLLRHLRAEKVVMVDMDRTLVDNAVIVRGGNPALHYEAMGKVSYLAAEPQLNSPLRPRSHTLRDEIVYVRPGARRLLRRIGVEWGIPLLLVTKSTSRRTEAILTDVLDPNGELFSYARCFTAESIVRDGDKLEDLVSAVKSARTVLQQWKPNGTTRAVAVLDDAPHVWEEADWPRTVPVAPYTLDRVDPAEYFSDDGFIASLTMDALYNHKSVVCTCTLCDADPRGPTMSSARCDFFSSSSSDSEESEEKTKEEAEEVEEEKGEEGGRGQQSEEVSTTRRMYLRQPSFSSKMLMAGDHAETAMAVHAIVDERGDSDEDETTVRLYDDAEEVTPL